MTGTTMVVLIVLISVGFGVLYDMYKKHLEFKEKTLKYEADATQKSHSLNQKVEQLEQRVQTLEKIVTDEGYQVNKDINNL